MARGLSIRLEDATYNLAPTKVERRKVYGWTELRATDSEGQMCRSASLDSNGVTIIPTGAIKLGIVGEDGRWLDKSELQPVHSNGSKAELIQSSFDKGINLDKKASVEDLLDLLATSIYVLDGEGVDDLAKKTENDIYSFRFNYNTDYEDSPAFLVSNGQQVFIIVGRKAQFEFLSLDEAGDLNLEEDEPDELDLDDLDFSMM